MLLERRPLAGWVGGILPPRRGSMKLHKLLIAGFVITLGTLLLASCTAQTEHTQSQSQATPALTVDPGTAATLTGTVKFTGSAPKPIQIDMSVDPSCKGQNVAEPVVTKNGNLANVFVYVKQGLPDGNWASTGPQVEIVQQGCKYVPHVVGVVAGQTVRILNADETMHNIHPMPQHNREWNAAQMSHGEPLVKKFDNPELMIPVKCNQHPWMKMYVNVVSHPFFAVSDPNGKFDINGLPPGTYTIAAVHETLGEQTQQFTVGPKESKSLGFTFSAQNSAAAAK